jgi:TIR domain
MPYDVFLSYTHIKDYNGAVAKFLGNLEPELFKKSGIVISVFRDKRDIEPGEDWNRFISEQLKSAKILLVLLSPTWLTSEPCKSEYEQFRAFMAQAPQKRIVALIWDKTNNAFLNTSQKDLLTDVMKYQIVDWSSHQYDDFKTPDQQAALGELAEKLVALLKEIYLPPPAAPPL